MPVKRKVGRPKKTSPKKTSPKKKKRTTRGKLENAVINEKEIKDNFEALIEYIDDIKGTRNEDERGMMYYIENEIKSIMDIIGDIKKELGI